MKKLVSLLLIIAAAVGCASSSSAQDESTVIEYKAMTRGRNRHVVINKDAITIAESGRNNTSTVMEIKPEQWKGLLAEVNTIKLNGMAALKSPTDKRLYDGAAIASLIITRSGKVYESSSFDHGYPPAEIAALVNKVVLLSKMDKEKNNED